jgi:pimeloyl-ACP methyl ester carboxylesterase
VIPDGRSDSEPRETSAADGYRLSYRRWSPGGDPVGTVVILNGIMSHSAWVTPLADPIVAAGWRLVGADRRGTGHNDEARGDAPSAQTVIDDAVTIAAGEAPAGTPLVLVGWCWGAVLGLNALRPLQRRRGAVDRFVMIAPGLHPTAAVREAAKRHDAAAAAAGAVEDAPVVATPIEDTMFTAGPYLDGFIRRDDRRLRHVTPRYRAIMNKLAFGAVGALRRLDVPTRVLLATDDPATDNAATRKALARCPEGVVSIVEVASGHGMQFDVPQVVAAHIVAATI